MKKVKQTIGKYFYFLLDYLRFKTFLKRQPYIREVEKLNERICIVVLPWMGNAVPWFAITLALILNQRKKDVFILFDDLPFGDDYLFHSIQSKLIHQVLLKVKIPFKNLSDFQDSNKVDEIVVKRLTSLNSLHYTKGETNKVKRNVYEKKIFQQLSMIYKKQESFFKNELFSQIIVPGGIWGSSGVSAYLTKQHRVQLTTYDSGRGVMLLSIFGIAAQLNDISYSFNKVLENSDEKQFAILKGKEQLEKRRNGEDMYQHFNDDKDFIINNEYFLVLLNSVWDSAALGIHSVYESMIDWILDSIGWVLNNTDKTIVIRQHPAERDESINNTDSYEIKIKSKFGNDKRIIFIEAKSNLNTYQLIENSICVLGFSSTSIVESVALGKPAIIVSSTYYSGFGIVFNTASRNEYYKYLSDASEYLLEVTDEMKDRACICNYITQSCNWIKTEFTPNPLNFRKWYKKNYDDLLGNNVFVKAILTKTPVSLLKHNENFNDK